MLYGRRRRRTFKRRKYPYRRRRFSGRRRYYSRTNRRKNYYRYGTRTKVRGLFMADATYVKLKEVANFDLAATAGNTGVYRFRGNSLYDPDFTSTGGQPSGFDQYMAFYNNYFVGASKITLEGYAADTTDSRPYDVFVWPTKYSAIQTGAFDPLENPMCRTRFVSGDSASSRNYIRISHYATTTRMMIKPLASNDRELWGTETTDPTESWYWWIGIANYDVTNPISLYAKVTLTYYVKFLGRKQIAET